MGLDMYLEKRTFVGNKYRDPKDRVKVTVPKTQEKRLGVIKTERVQEITQQVAYWRKANQIHAWFVANVQDGNDDCKDYNVSKEQLVELRDLCQKVLTASKLTKGEIANGQTLKDGEWVSTMEEGEYIEDPAVAKELLPTESGFFFGGTDYDQYYVQDLKDTVQQLDTILKEDDSGDFYYSSSW